MSIAKFDRPEGWKERLSQRIRMVRYQLGVVQYIAFVALLANTIGRIEHRTYRKKRLRGEKINANEVFSPPFKSEWYAHYQQVVASIAPNEGKNRRKAKQMKQESYPLPEYSYEFSEPPLSGNVINGVGETQPRRVVQPFFSTGYTGPWNKLERLFQGLNKPSLANFILRIFWMDRNRVGLVARQQQPVTEPHKITTEIKEKAREHGAALVGITPLEEDMRFQNFDLPFRFAISIAVPMNRTLMLEAPTHDTMHEIMST
ncbi:MAG TPA: hypothetical protein DCE41_17415, partial [Cytophagales bacterium]|nr:hypothetical protein [Cytophagales bacterium]